MSLKGSPVISTLCRKLELKCQRHQSCRHRRMFTMFGSSDDRVLLTMYPAKLK